MTMLMYMSKEKEESDEIDLSITKNIPTDYLLALFTTTKKFTACGTLFTGIDQYTVLQWP